MLLDEKKIRLHEIQRELRREVVAAFESDLALREKRKEERINAVCIISFIVISFFVISQLIK